MQWVLDLLPEGWRTGFEIVRDVVTPIVGVLGACLAYLAIKMRRRQSAIEAEQTRIRKEQTEIAKRQEKLDLEREQISKRLAEIEEVQHAIFQEHMNREPILTLAMAGQSEAKDVVIGMFPGSSSEPLKLPSPIDLTLAVHNKGNKSCEGCQWSVLVPYYLTDVIKEGNDTIHHVVHDLDESATTVEWESETYWELSGSLQERIFADAMADITRLQVMRHADTEAFKLFWKVTSAEADTPESGYGTLAFTKDLHGRYQAKVSMPFYVNT
jgi:hypothetical protein